jgi:hypothetical protein
MHALQIKALPRRLSLPKRFLIARLCHATILRLRLFNPAIASTFSGSIYLLITQKVVLIR